MSQTKNRLSSDTSNESSESGNILTGMVNASEDCVKDYPFTASTIALGVGVFAGLLIASAIGRREEERQSNYFARIGSQIASSIGNVVPDSINWNR